MAEMMSLTAAKAERDRLIEQLKAIRAYIKVLESQLDTIEEPEAEA